MVFPLKIIGGTGNISTGSGYGTGLVIVGGGTGEIITNPVKHLYVCVLKRKTYKLENGKLYEYSFWNREWIVCNNPKYDFLNGRSSR